MIIGLLTVIIMFFGGGGSFEHYLLNIKKPLKEAVENRQVINDVMDVSEQLGEQLKEENKALADLKETFILLNQQYDTTQDDFKKNISNMLDIHKKGNKDILDARTMMKKYLTKEEWGEIFAINHEA